MADIYSMHCIRSLKGLIGTKIRIYTSVERCILRENPDTPSKGEIIWMMATASDARGWLPMWMQKLGVPGAVIKDVGLVMKWVQEVREKFREGFGTRV